MSWVNPTGFVDSGSVWTSETLAYDENTGTYAYASALKSAWTNYLELTHAILSCNKVQMWVSISGANISAIEVDIYYGGDWQNIYSGTITTDAFVEYAIGSTQSVTAMRVRFYSTKAITDGCMVHEADFWEVTGVTEWLVGTTVGVTTSSGSARVGRKVAGAVACISDVGGLAGVTRRVAGLVSGLSSTVGSLTITAVVVLLAGMTSGISTVTGAIKRSKTITGISTGLVGVLASISQMKCLAVAVAGVCQVSGLVKATRKIVGITVGVCQISGLARITRSLSGTISGLSAVVGGLTLTKAIKYLAGAILGVASVTANLTISGVFVVLAGIVQGIATIVGRLTYHRILKVYTNTSISQDLNFFTSISKNHSLMTTQSRDLILEGEVVKK